MIIQFAWNYDEILLKGYLVNQHWKQVAQMNQAWKYTYIKQLSQLPIQFCNLNHVPVANENVSLNKIQFHLGKIGKNLKILNIKEICDLGNWENIMQAMDNCSQLKILRIQRAPCNSHRFHVSLLEEFYNRLPQLQQLELNDCKGIQFNNDEIVGAFQKLPLLNSLSIQFKVAPIKIRHNPRFHPYLVQGLSNLRQLIMKKVNIVVEWNQPIKLPVSLEYVDFQDVFISWWWNPKKNNTKTEFNTLKALYEYPQLSPNYNYDPKRYSKTLFTSFRDSNDKTIPTTKLKHVSITYSNQNYTELDEEDNEYGNYYEQDKTDYNLVRDIRRIFPLSMLSSLEKLELPYSTKQQREQLLQVCSALNNIDDIDSKRLRLFSQLLNSSSFLHNKN